MKKLTELIASNIIAQNNTTQSLESLGESIQKNGKEVILGNQNSYLKIGDNEISLVSNGKKLNFTQLLEILDFINATRTESTEGSDQDEGLDDPDFGQVPLPDDEGVLELDDSTTQPPAITIESTTLLEVSSGSISPEGDRTWSDRQLNIVFPEVSWVTIDQGRFFLEPGNYQIIARTPALNSDYLISRLSSPNRLWEGSFTQSVSSVSGVSGNEAIGLDSFVFAAFSINERTPYTLQTYIGTDFGFGALGAPGFGATNDTNLSGNFIYSQVIVTRLG